jgi:hypothetical protein
MDPSPRIDGRTAAIAAGAGEWDAADLKARARARGKAKTARAGKVAPAAAAARKDLKASKDRKDPTIRASARTDASEYLHKYL